MASVLTIFYFLRPGFEEFEHFKKNKQYLENNLYFKIKIRLDVKFLLNKVL